ncbi:MAG: DUF1572 family protein [Candidatus Korobacteraceae bacterium]|jgi:hypothetical protein
MNSDAGAVFLRYSSTRLEALSSWIDECLGRLTPDQIWRRGEAQNAVGNLVVHLRENVYERITLALGHGGPSMRNRDAEFDPNLRRTPEELRQQLKATICEAVVVLRQFPAERLTEQTPKPGYDRLVLENIFTVVEHFAVHTGQIMFVTKQMTQHDLGDISRSKKVK